MTVDFNDYFWGEKNSGYEVLYHNMKHGVTASKELTEYFKERSNLDEHNSKVLLKLAHKVGSSGSSGTFAPLLIILKASAERLSELHTQMVQKTAELVKSILKYADELHKKHKSVKEEESGTQDAVQQMKESTIAVQKAKDVYQSRLQEVEKLKKENGSAKEIEKAEAKLKKHQEEYRVLAEKHNPIKQEFERRMSVTCKRFQDIEEAHLKQMKEFIMLYIDIVQSNQDMVGQVHNDFKRQFLDLTVDKLLEQFVLNKYTGLEKPEDVDLELSPNTHQDLLNDASTSSAVGDLQTIAASFMSAPAHESSPSASQHSATQSSKKESHLFGNWFGSSSTSSIPQPNPSTSANVVASAPIAIAKGSSNHSNGTQDEISSSPSQSTKLSSKFSYGEMFKFNKSNANKSTALEQQHAAVEPHPNPSGPSSSKEQQQKSSRRTTSLLNLFMSNSQGKQQN